MSAPVPSVFRFVSDVHPNSIYGRASKEEREAIRRAVRSYYDLDVAEFDRHARRDFLPQPFD